MMRSLPDADAPRAVWRALANSAAAAPERRDALVAQFPALDDAALVSVVPRLVFRARGRTRVTLARALLALARTRPVPAPIAYTALAELFGATAAIRPLAVETLAVQTGSLRDAIERAISAAARFSWIRGAGSREAAALEAWRSVGADPYGGTDPATVFRAWREGTDLEPHLDAILLLASAGAARSAAEQTRFLTSHVLRRLPHASEIAVALLRWLGEECDSVDDLPASVRLPGWRSTAAEAIARTSLASHGAASTISHLARRLSAGPFDRALLEAGLRACLLDARRGPGDSASALGDAVHDLTDALARATAFDPAWPRTVALLLGREASGALVGAGRWLTDDLRVAVHRVALTHEPLGARAVALDDLESGAVPLVLVPLLKQIAQGDADPLVRERARRLVRGV